MSAPFAPGPWYGHPCERGTHRRVKNARILLPRLAALASLAKDGQAMADARYLARLEEELVKTRRKDPAYTEKAYELIVAVALVNWKACYAAWLQRDADDERKPFTKNPFHEVGFKVDGVGEFLCTGELMRNGGDTTANAVTYVTGSGVPVIPVVAEMERRAEKLSELVMPAPTERHLRAVGS